ncbi:hypothetical protein P4482_09140 [Neobacillus thermocopriae]|uniref:hypothetical protein n=1 Tax=Neobacillus thermocopriae TaxID=1215031 RepID=UPI002E23C894|nr:hypothetical protein [Neobacillus thermocopriae]MED3714383.1 hypothetical protein [Neobacillus thermocopriae]
MKNVVELKPYEVYEFPWGSAIKRRNGQWEKVFLKPNGQEIDISNVKVILHDNGIEFI